MSAEIDHTALEGEVVYSVEETLRMTVRVDYEAMDRFIESLNRVCAKMGVPPSGTIIDGSLIEPVTDPTRLIDRRKE